MSTVEKIDNAIEKIIDNLMEEYEKTGWNGPTQERKAQIINQIVKLRASMNPESTPKK